MKNYLLLLLRLFIPLSSASRVNFCLELIKGYIINSGGKESAESDWVFPLTGDEITEIERTGLNAYKKQSPTFLHLMYLQIENGYPTPKNIYKALLKAKTM